MALGASPSPAVNGSDEIPTLCPDSELAAVVRAAARTSPATAATTITTVRRQPVTTDPSFRIATFVAQGSDP